MTLLTPQSCFPMEILGSLPKASFEGECLAQNATCVPLSSKQLILDEKKNPLPMLSFLMNCDSALI